MKIVNDTPEIGFDDVLLLHGRSEYSVDEEVHRAQIRTQLTPQIELDIPVVSAAMPGISGPDMAIALSNLGALGILHPFHTYEAQLADLARVKDSGARVGVAVLDESYGLNGGYEHAVAAARRGADLISVESLQAHNTRTIDFVRRLKDNVPGVQVMVGVVITGEGCEDLIEAGADCIRVGIGGGSHCTTRLMTGVGRPQLSLLQECYEVTREASCPLIIDGGIRQPGDVVKALVFGADAACIGGMLAGTDECPGQIIEREGQKYKQSWGMCTTTAARHEQDYSGSGTGSDSEAFQEGVAGLIPYKGSVSHVLSRLASGLRRSMWYQGATSIADMRENAQVVICSANAVAGENKPRIETSQR